MLAARARALLVAATVSMIGASVTACGPQTLGDLPRPALVVTVIEPGAFCSATYAIDADDQVWLETGCGSSSGLVAQGRVTASDRAALDALMDRVLALPDDPGCEVPSPSARGFRFLRTTPGSDDWPETRQCEPSVPADARELAARAEALVAASSDGGTRDGA